MLHSYDQGSIGDNITTSISKHTWICAICGQGFTRRGTGVRHSRNLHSGNAMLVRPYEYIVGRLRGTYKQSDPLLFRRKRREGNTPITRLTSVNDPRSTKPIEFQNSIIHERHGPQQKGNQRADTYGVGTQTGPSLGLSEQISGHMMPASSVEPMRDTRSRSEKLKEITELVRMHYPPDTARSIIIAASFQAYIRDDSSLDQTVEYLRNIPKR